MTVLDVRKCNAKRAYTGELEFAFEPDREWLDIPFVQFAAPAAVRLNYEIFEDDWVDVRGTLTFCLKGACSRCLEETEQTFTGEVEASFSPNGEEDEAYGYRGGVIDFTEALRDALLFALPSRLVCEGGCELPAWK